MQTIIKIIIVVLSINTACIFLLMYLLCELKNRYDGGSGLKDNEEKKVCKLKDQQ